jgi:carbon-monoxide dehydrogenase medium subunit
MTVTRDFDFHRASSVEEAIRLLGSLEGDAKLLAGGHSLIPTMKVRLAAPDALIDLGAIEALRSIESVDGGVRIGAMATHNDVATSVAVGQAVPALAEAAEGSGDLQVRNSGTIGGSLAHADPSADYPALVLALNATIETASSGGTRTIAADDFFTGMFATALGEQELITGVVFGAAPAAAYVKFPNPASRYAVTGVAVSLAGTPGQVTGARVGVTGARVVPFRLTALEDALTSGPLDGVNVAAVVAAALDPAELLTDSAASAAYRAHLTGVMAARAVALAADRGGL